MFLPVCEYRPDSARIKSDYSNEILNVFAGDGFYLPCPSFQKINSVKIDFQPYGAFGIKTLQDSVIVFMGTAKNLWMMQSIKEGFIRVSKKDKSTRLDKECGPYHAGPENRWCFTQFGSLVIATNGVDLPQVLDVTNIAKNTKFRDLGKDPKRKDLPKENIPPLGKTVKNFGNFIALMDVDDSPNTLYWSGLNDADWWVVGQKDCDTQTFYDGGRIISASEATNPVIFLQDAIYAANFVPGSDIIFSFQKIHNRKSLKDSFSLVSRGGLSFFADEAGFFQLDSQGLILPIGQEKIDKTFLKSYHEDKNSQIMGVIDPFYSRIYWALDKKGTGVFNSILVYDWILQKWTKIHTNIHSLIPVYTFGVTLEELDSFSLEDNTKPASPDNPSHIEKLAFSLDSRMWENGSPVLLGFYADEYTGEYFAGTFNGPAMEAIVTTSETGPTNGQMTRIDGIVPVCDSATVHVRAGRRNVANVANPIDWTEERQASKNTGFVHLRSRARYHRFRLRIPAGQEWSRIEGVDVNMMNAGRR